MFRYSRLNAFSGLKPLLFLSLFLSSIFASDLTCPQCGFKNQDSDRYCLQCMALLRNLSTDEKSRLDQANKNRDTVVNQNLKTQADSQAERVRKEQTKNTLPPLSNPDLRKKILSVKGVSITLGMERNRIRNYLSANSVEIIRRKEDYWQLNLSRTTTAQWFNQDVYLEFLDSRLTKWQQFIFNDYYIARAFPLKSESIEPGMNMEKVENLWGKPDYKNESCSDENYFLKSYYFTKEPAKSITWDGPTTNNVEARTVLLKSGTAYELTYNFEGIVTEIKSVMGETRTIKEPAEKKFL